MIACEAFRERFQPGSEDAALLEHLRSCDRCLDFAVSVDPDTIFRCLGGDDLVPPGGIDAFVDGVMQQVRVRAAESTVDARPAVAWTRYLALAATLAAAVSGAVLFNRFDAPTPQAPVQVATRGISPPGERAVPVAFATKPVVEAYESRNAVNATIVEMPSETADDIKMVMIFDENLPVDL